MKYVALLRGINVGGNTMIRMEELRRVFEALGFQNVVSYINSGNLAFDVSNRVLPGPPRETELALTEQIEKAIEANFGCTVSVMIREQREISDIIANNPFHGEYASHKEMHVLFLKTPLTSEQIAQLQALAPEQERFVASGRHLFVHLPMGVADSFLGRGQFERKLKVTVTARNWRTVEKLAVL